MNRSVWFSTALLKLMLFIRMHYGFIAFKVQSPFPCVYFKKHAKEILLFAESSEPIHLLDLSKEYITSTIEASVSRKQNLSL